jgi:hypothetical protein
VLQHTASAAQMTTEEAAAFGEYVERGCDLPSKMMKMLTHAAAILLGRPIVVCDTVEGSSTVFLPALPGDAPPAKTAAPIIIEDSCIVLPYAVRDFVSGHDVVLPPVAVTFSCAYPESGDVGGYSADGFSIVIPSPSAADAAPVMLGEMLPALDCNAVRADEHGCLSFATFPATYFAVSRYGHQSEADALNKAYEYGEDPVAAAYLDSLGIQNASFLSADADGHCLVHALSRCLVGKQYLWHALRHATHVFMPAQDSSRQLSEIWKKNEALAGLVDILPLLADQAHPDYPFYKASSKSFTDSGDLNKDLKVERGMSHEHIFALACVLRRPILLLDSPKAANRQSFLFLPLTMPPEAACTRKLLAIGWRCQEHGHFIAVVPSLGTKPCYIAKAALPHNEDGSIAVYAAPSALGKEEVSALAYSYLGGDQEKYEIGGDLQLDIGPWLRPLLRRFEQSECDGNSIWAMHELVRSVASSEEEGGTTSSLLGSSASFSAWSSVTMDKLECIPKIADFSRLYCRTIKDMSFGICYSCTRTFSKRVTCSHCQLKLTAFDMKAGRYNFKDKDRMPVPSTRGSASACCIHKHWCAAPSITVGSQVWARNLCSYFAPATVLDFDTVRGTYDLEFRYGHRRFCCPMEDVMHGFPLDSSPVTYTAPASLGGLKVTVCRDSDPLLATTVAKLDSVIDASAAAQGLTLAAAAKTRIKELLTSVLQQRKTTTKSAYAPLFVDEQGNDVVWHWMDNDGKYVPYEREANGAVEAAFRAKEVFTIVPTSWGEFEIDLSELLQIGKVNTRRMRRCISRPLPREQWECSACTYVHASGLELSASRCSVCSTPRSGSQLVVTHRSVLEEREERVRSISWPAAERQTAADPRLARGGDLYNAAIRLLGDQSRSTAATFPRAYPEMNFVMHTEDRFVVVPPVLPVGHPLHVLVDKEAYRVARGALFWRGLLFTQLPDLSFVLDVCDKDY